MAFTMIIFPLLALLSYGIVSEAQYVPNFGLERFNPFPSGFSIFPSTFNPFPYGFPKFPDFWSIFGFGKELEKKIISTVEKATKAGGIYSVNGTTVIKQTIGGKKMIAVIPRNSSYSFSTKKLLKNGHSESTVRLTIDGQTEVYTTVNGNTTVTDGNGTPLTKGSFFSEDSTVDPEVTDVPDHTEAPEGPKASETTTTSADSESEETVPEDSRVITTGKPVDGNKIDEVEESTGVSETPRSGDDTSRAATRADRL